MKRCILFLIAVMVSIVAKNQNLVGFKGSDIQAYMKKNKTELKPENVVNSRYKYLKYADMENMQTVLFFLDNDSTCKSIRMIYDLALKNEKIKEFNTIYNKSNANQWIDTRDGKEFIIEYRDDKWSFTVTIEQAKTN